MKSPKALDLFWKAYFQTKVTKSGRCYNLVPGRILWGNFRGNRSSWGAFFMFLHVMFALCTSQNSHMEALWLSKSQQSRKNKKQRKVFVQKKKKKKLKEERKSAILSRTEKKPWWKRLVLAELHVGIQISNKEVAVKPKFVIQKVKTEVSFYSCKYQCWYKTNRLESYA